MQYMSLCAWCAVEYPLCITLGKMSHILTLTAPAIDVSAFMSICMNEYSCHFYMFPMYMQMWVVSVCVNRAFRAFAKSFDSINVIFSRFLLMFCNTHTCTRKKVTTMNKQICVGWYFLFSSILFVFFIWTRIYAWFDTCIETLKHNRLPVNLTLQLESPLNISWDVVGREWMKQWCARA